MGDDGPNFDELAEQTLAKAIEALKQGRVRDALDLLERANAEKALAELQRRNQTSGADIRGPRVTAYVDQPSTRRQGGKGLQLPLDVAISEGIRKVVSQFKDALPTQIPLDASQREIAAKRIKRLVDLYANEVLGPIEAGLQNTPGLTESQRTKLNAEVQAGIKEIKRLGENATQPLQQQTTRGAQVSQRQANGSGKKI